MTIMGLHRRWEVQGQDGLYYTIKAWKSEITPIGHLVFYNKEGVILTIFKHENWINIEYSGRWINDTQQTFPGKVVEVEK